MRMTIAFLTIALIAPAARADEQIAGCSDYTTSAAGGSAACDAAIAAEKDAKTKSTLLFRRAYMEDAKGDFATYPKALADLDEAIKLWPQNASALHERGYLENEYGRWKDAERDLDAQIALAPTEAGGYQERALSRFKLAELAGVLEDDNAMVMIGPPAAASYFARARANMWLGDFDAARKDIDSGLKLAAGDKKAADEADALKADIAKWTQRSANPSAADACGDAYKKGDFSRPGLIGDCTRAFLDARKPADKADWLTARAVTWLMAAHDEKASTADSEIAAALNPTNETLSNLGFAYMRAHHSTAAVEAFDRSIALHGDFWNYAGRASAKMNVGDLQGALDDAGKSVAIKPNDLALIVQGDVSYARTKSYDQAKTYWLQAWQLGARDDDLAARLKAAGVTPPPDASAKP